jgi:hypothetical protein
MAARFVDRWLDGLLDELRPGTPRKVSDAEVERVRMMIAGVDAEGGHALVNAVAGRHRG